MSRMYITLVPMVQWAKFKKNIAIIKCAHDLLHDLPRIIVLKSMEFFFEKKIKVDLSLSDKQW